MRIMHFIASRARGYSGMERHVHELAVEQSKSHIVAVLGPLHLENFFTGVNYLTIDTERSRFSPSLKKDTEKAIQLYRPDIIHTHARKSTQLIGKLKHNKNFRWVATIHNEKNNIQAFKGADFIIGVSRPVLEKIPVGGKYTVIENWVNPERFKGFRKQKPEHYLFIGRLERTKNVERLLRAWVQNTEKLLIIGDGTQRDMLKKLTKKLAISERVNFLGHQENLSEYLAKAYATIFSSEKEGSPKVVFESLYCKTAVLSTPIGIAPDLLPPQCIAKDMSQNAFNQLLNHWVNNKKDLNNIQAKLFKKITQCYTVSTISEKIIDVYHQLL